MEWTLIASARMCRFLLLIPLVVGGDFIIAIELYLIGLVGAVAIWPTIKKDLKNMEKSRHEKAITLGSY